MRVAGLAGGISRTALISADAHLGAGVSIGHGAVVEAGAYLDDGVQVGPMAVVCGSVRLGRGVLVFPHAVIGADPQIRDPGLAAFGTTEIGPGTVLREGATVHRGTEGRSTVVGADCLVMARPSDRGAGRCCSRAPAAFPVVEDPCPWVSGPVDLTGGLRAPVM
jgi:acyl-[acyl carrier protein]--UDP-N-acetylglucosamine O-acyltransferase